MLPVVDPDGWSTVIQALVYAVLMVPVSMAPWYLHMTGIVYGVLAGLFSLGYLYYTVRFARIPRTASKVASRTLARSLLKASVIYLPLLLIAMMLDAASAPIGQR